MIDDGIADGDLAILRQCQSADSGDTVAAVVEGEATLKRLKRLKNSVVLIPANKQMSEMKFPAKEVEIRGVLVGLVRTSIR